MELEPITMIVLAGIIGLLVLVLIVRSRGGAATAQQRELQQLREQAAGAEARESALEARVSDRDEQIAALRTERDEARQEQRRLSTQLSAANGELQEIRAAHTARQEEIAAYRSELETRFRGIAGAVTELTREQLTKEFRDLARQRWEQSQRESGQNQRAVGNIVQPIRERLDELRRYVNESERRRASDYARVSDGVDQLVSETSGLRKILNNPEVRDAWGEQHLRNVMEAAGMTDHVDYIEQERINTPHGALRPDVVVHIPNGVRVVIDAKTPFKAYTAAVQAQDEAKRKQLLADHAKSLLSHAKTLKKRDYSRWVDDSPDFVVMYIPTDPILDAAIDADSTVWQEAWNNHRVLIATPGLLIAFMRTVALAWQRQVDQESALQNAKQIAAAGTDLYEQLRTFAGHLDELGKTLGRAVLTYNQGVSMYQSRVLVPVRKIEELSEIERFRRISDVEQVEVGVRKLSSDLRNQAPRVEPRQQQASGEEAAAPAPVHTNGQAANTEPAASPPIAAPQPSMSQPNAGTKSANAGSKPKRAVGYILWGRSYRARSSKEVLHGVAEQLHKKHPRTFHKAMTLRGRTRAYITRSETDHMRPMRIGSSQYWLEGNHKPATAISLAEQLLEIFGHKGSDLQVLYS